MTKKSKPYDPLTKCPLCGTYVLKSTMRSAFAGSIEVCIPCYNTWNNQE